MCDLHTRILSVEKLKIFPEDPIVDLKMSETGKTQELIDIIKSTKILKSYLLVKLPGLD